MAGDWLILRIDARDIEVIMPGFHGRYAWRFVGKQPLVLSIFEGLFFANMAASFTLTFLGEYLIPHNLPNSQICPAMSASGVKYAVPNWICWYAEKDLVFTFGLLGVIVLILLIYRQSLERDR
jgi:hypothetical protein